MSFAMSFSISPIISSICAVAAGSIVGVKTPSAAVFVLINLSVFFGYRVDRLAGFPRSGDDLVVHIGEITRIDHSPFAKAMAQHAKQKIEDNGGAGNYLYGRGYRPSAHTHTW